MVGLLDRSRTVPLSERGRGTDRFATWCFAFGAWREASRADHGSGGNRGSFGWHFSSDAFADWCPDSQWLANSFWGSGWIHQGMLHQSDKCRQVSEFR